MPKRIRPCFTKKRIFVTELDAKIALMRMIKRDKGEIRYYHCPKFSYFHLTSQPKESTNA